jgi:hypothetical protein
MNQYVRFDFVPKSAQPFHVEYRDVSDEDMNKMTNTLFEHLVSGGVVYFTEQNPPGVLRENSGKSRFINMSEIITFTVTYNDTVPQ